MRKEVTMKNRIPEKQITVAALLLKGKYTVNEIIHITGVQDPRSHIRYIRRAGYMVSDMWVKENGSRIKRYWINEAQLKEGTLWGN